MFFGRSATSPFRNDVIPIVMGARPQDYAKVARRKSFIHVDEFDSPKQLASYLHKLDKNDTLNTPSLNFLHHPSDLSKTLPFFSWNLDCWRVRKKNRNCRSTCWPNGGRIVWPSQRETRNSHKVRMPHSALLTVNTSAAQIDYSR